MCVWLVHYKREIWDFWRYRASRRSKTRCWQPDAERTEDERGDAYRTDAKSTDVFRTDADRRDAYCTDAKQEHEQREDESEDALLHNTVQSTPRAVTIVVAKTSPGWPYDMELEPEVERRDMPPVCICFFQTTKANPTQSSPIKYNLTQSKLP
jgi:hypothetical protein